MSDYSSPTSGGSSQQQNFNQSSAFAAALQRAKQIAAKINPATGGNNDNRTKRPLEDGTDPEPKKIPGLPNSQMNRPLQGGMPLGNGPPGDDMKLNIRSLQMGPTLLGKNTIEIMIPGPKVGLIIGKGGETIKQLQEKSGAKMVVIQDGPTQELEKPLHITGEPQKVELAKQLVYELITEKEMKNFNNRNPGRGRNDHSNSGNDNYNEYGAGGDLEILVPKAAVGVVIGKGGDMIKKIQADTQCKVQFQQARDEGPGDRRCFLSGPPQQVELARQKIEELIDSVGQRDGGFDGGPGGMGGQGGGGGRGGRGGNRSGRGGRNAGGGGGGHFGGGDRNGGGDYGNMGGWNDRGAIPQQEVTFTVPANKCGVIIGRGGDTIKQINQQSGAYCELDRRSNQNQNEKTFVIKGDPECIESAKRIISDKIQMPIHFLTVGGNSGGGNVPMANNIPTAYPGMNPQNYNPQGWGNMPNYGQQQWPQQPQGPEGNQNAVNNSVGQMPGNANAASVQSIQVNPTTGQPDYSLQWAEYYRSMGMIQQAEVIEQQAKARTSANSNAMPTTAGPSNPAAAAAAAANQVPAATGGGAAAVTAPQPDYSAQWAEYYRSIGKIKEAEAIEAQMKNKQPSAVAAAAAAAASTTGAQPTFQTSTVNPANYQQAYSGYQQATGGYYGTQPQAPVPGVSQANYGFQQYSYGGQPAPAPPNPPDN